MNYEILLPPIPLAVDGGDVILPYVKPCHGCFVLRIPGGGGSGEDEAVL